MLLDEEDNILDIVVSKSICLRIRELIHPIYIEV